MPKTSAKKSASKDYDSTPACLTCQTDDQLKTCAGCHIAKYCSASCQKNDFSAHHKCCKQIKKLAATITAEEKRLISRRLVIPGNRGDPFRRLDAQKIPGFIQNFGRVQSAREYLNTSYELCKVLLQMAKEHKSGYILESALDQLSKMSRLCYLISYKVERLIPFVLLDLNRDMDAHAFTVFWIGVEMQIGMTHLLGSDVLGLTLHELPAIIDFRSAGCTLHEMDFKFLQPNQTAFLAALILIKVDYIGHLISRQVNIHYLNHNLNTGLVF